MYLIVKRLWFNYFQFHEFYKFSGFSTITFIKYKHRASLSSVATCPLNAIAVVHDVTASPINYLLLGQL